MKFRNKIIISFCIIIFVPILLALVVIFSFQQIQIRAIEQTYGVEDTDYSYFSNPMQLFSSFAKEAYTEISETVRKHPEQMEDQSYLEHLNSLLEEKSSYLVVRRADMLTYIGEDAAPSLLLELPGYGEADGSVNSGMYIDGEQQALVKQIDFKYPDSTEGSAFIVTLIEETVPEVKTLLADIIISIVMILVLTACMLTIWIYTSLINPDRKSVV